MLREVFKQQARIVICLECKQFVNKINQEQICIKCQQSNFRKVFIQQIDLGRGT